MDLYCRKCRQKLTNETLSQIAPAEVRYVDGEEAIPAGGVLSADEFDVVFGVKVTHIVHTRSLRLVDHNDAALHRGCCGPGRLDCYNQVCADCGEPIGLLFADCWAMHFTAINAQWLRMSDSGWY